ncbi:MAG: hypothetical protein EHM41_05515 [Chloroflexi bacterium]|nr:MAG: hypothetical protein EHM41_05515 [Chloroflexota bacterium]
MDKQNSISPEFFSPEYISAEFEQEVREAMAVPEADQGFLVSLKKSIILDQPRRAAAPGSFITRPVWVGIFAVLVLMVVTVLAIGPSRVLAAVGQILGYIPGVGFVDLDTVRVLENSVVQQHEGRHLTVVRGVVNERGTDVWIEFSDEARPINDAWLETTDSQRFELLNWSYSPDEPGTHGVAAHFPPLPSDVHQVTLALPEGWRIPLTWVQGSESSLWPVNIISAPLSPSLEDQAALPASSITTASDACNEALDIEFCVKAAVRAEGEMQVLIEAAPRGEYTPGSSFSLSMFDAPGETQNLTLSDAEGHAIPVNATLIQVQGEPAYISTLHFPGAQDLQGLLSLNIPAVLVSIPISGEITIDLGNDPTPGQSLEIDQTIDVAGNPVHFGQAVLDSSGRDSLRLTITSDPFDEQASIRPYVIDPGRPEGILDRYGAGSGPNNLSISVDLQQQSGLITGILRIPLVSASLKVQGPFTLTFDAPAEQPAATPEPLVIENGAFEPLLAGEPLTMDAYLYTGRALAPGDLLAVALGDTESILYAASPELEFSPELVAVLPGQVLAVYPHPDRLGIDYLTGEYDQEASATLYRQLYTLRFGDPAPRLLVGQFERSAFNFTWSYDGRFLAYLVTDDRPGQNYQRYVRLIDLDCRTSNECSVFSAETGNQDLFGLEWSPNDYRLSAVGASHAEETSGSSDIFLLTLNAETYQTELTNLTLSPSINDLALAIWPSDGRTLLYACETGETAINEYSLCTNDLTEGKDDVVISSLPWNMRAFHLVNEKYLLDWNPVMYNGIYSLRTYDLQTGQTNVLFEWPSSGKHWVETTISPDGFWVGTVIDDMGGLLVINIETLESVLVMPSEEDPFFVTWVK